MSEELATENLKTFLLRAKPEWNEEVMTVVLEKLAKVNIHNVITMVCALRGKGKWKEGLNNMLQDAGQKAFTEATLSAFCNQADELDKELKPQPRQAGAAASADESVHPGAAKTVQWQPLPAEISPPRQQFKIDRLRVNVHEAPAWESKVLKKKKEGRVVVAVEETFNGWVRLATEPGWILRDLRGQRSFGTNLSPIGGSLRLAADQVVGIPGPQRFEVIAEPSVAVYKAPDRSSEELGLRQSGEVLLAEAQSYNGWVRLVGGQGWVPSSDDDTGALLRWKRLSLDEEISAVQADLNDIRASEPDWGYAAAVAAAKESGLAVVLAELHEQRRERQEFRERILAAAGNERTLREYAERAFETELDEEFALAQSLLNQAIKEREQALPEHARLLESLAVAAASGDLASIGAARDAAKKGGVPKKEIARVYALHARVAD